jgi:hypothetical protein
VRLAAVPTVQKCVSSPGVMKRDMNSEYLARATQLSDDALIARVKLLAQRSREATVELIAHLAVLEVRKLHRAEAGSLFRYCTEILRLSEAAACNRIQAARATRKFPVILDLLANGSVNLTTVRLLAPHLRPENHRALLAEATGMTRRQVDKLVARLAPQPDVPATIRKLPAPTPIVGAASAVTLALTGVELEGQAATTLGGSSAVSPPTMEDPETPPTSPVATPRAVVAPLSPGRYRVQFTVGKETEEQLRRLQDLLRGEIPDGDAGEIFVRALPLLLREVEKRKFAATPKPRPSRGTKPGSRHVPADVQREVWERDGGQCAFISKSGRRCTERSYLEFHHAHEPYALGGEATVENISLRCRTHNVYEAELIFGPYDPSRVRETPRHMASRSVTGPGTSSRQPRIGASG